MRCKFNVKKAHWSVLSLMSEIELECNNKKNGCAKIIKYDQLQSHLNTCDHEIVKCPGDTECKAEGIRKDMIPHIE